MGRRGFFAEINYQMQQAERRSRQQAAAAERARAAALREADRARQQAERAEAQALAADYLVRAEMEKEAKRLYLESRLAETAAMNAELANVYEQIDGLLAWTLEVDDFVDLEALKVTEVTHPPFDPGPQAAPLPAVPELVYPPQPTYVEPAAPKGLSSAFGGKQKHEAAVARARAQYDRESQLWHEQATALHSQYVADLERRKQAEEQRMQWIAEARAAYDSECQQREAQAHDRNQELTRFMTDLAFDVESAIQEYVGIVLSNSVYPEMFPVSYDHNFDLASRELTLRVDVPEPSGIPAVKEYRYIKAKDEIVATPLTMKAQKDRYAGAVWQVAVRTLHEVFEADRAGKIHSISLTVGTSHISPATGLTETVPLVIVAAERESFTTFDLANVVPQATLKHLGAAMSKSPFDLTPADASRGVRVRNA